MSFHHPDDEDALRTDIYLFCVPAHPNFGSDSVRGLLDHLP